MIRGFIVIALFTAAHAEPVTVNFGAQSPGGGVGNAAGSELPPGCRVMVGAFDLTPEQVAAAGSDHFTLQDHFIPFATTSVGTFNGVPQGYPGAFSGSVSLESEVHGGRRIYLWVLDAPDFASANAQLVFSAPGWTVPAFGSVSCQTSSAGLLEESAVLVSHREEEITSPTLGGVLHQAVPLAHPDASDADGDGRSALVEFATGSDPGVSDALPLDLLPGTLNLTRRVAGSGTTRFESAYFRYRIERSSDLADWHDFASEVQSVSTAPDPVNPSLETVTIVFPAPETGRHFFRVEVLRK